MKTPAQIVEQVLAEADLPYTLEEAPNLSDANYIDAYAVRSYITNAAQMVLGEVKPLLEPLEKLREKQATYSKMMDSAETDADGDEGIYSDRVNEAQEFWYDALDEMVNSLPADFFAETVGIDAAGSTSDEDIDAGIFDNDTRNWVG
jgi:hypothetical protein